MAYNNTPPRAEYTASSSQTVFPFLFKIFSDTDVKVYMTLSGATPNDETDILVLNTDYTVTINGDAGGEIILTNGASINDKITIIRSLKINRTVEYQKNGDLLASTLNADQEYQTYIIADKASEQARAIRIPNTAINVDTELESPVSNAYIKWNVTADRLENDTTIPDAVTTSSENAAAAALSETNAGISETNASDSSIEAQLRVWEAEAEKLTANSYALEAEDVFVKVYASDGDGTFTAINTTEYSALHYSLKSDASNAVLLAGDQTIEGTKTFSSNPISSATQSTATNALTRKDYVDLKAPLASPALTGIPTAPTATADTNTTQIATTEFVKSKSELDSIGVGQTWQYVTSSRAIGVTYTNNTGKPISASVRVTPANTSSSASLLISGNIADYAQGFVSTAIGQTIEGIVPAGATYVVNISGTCAMVGWSELR